METRPLGLTGLHVSVLGLGTVKIGRNTGLKHPQPFTIPSDEEARLLLERALALGVNLIDTAPAYGSSEERLGRLLPGRREDWVIATKAGEEWIDGASRFDFSPAAIRASVERSLRRLRTSWLDIVLLHANEEDVKIVESAEAIEALLDLRRRGVVRAIGVSTKTVEGGLRAIETGSDVVMVSYSPADTSQSRVLDAARARGAGVLVKKALASGHLETLAAAAQHDPVEHAMRFILSEKAVSAIVIGTLSPERLEHNARAADAAVKAAAGAPPTTEIGGSVPHHSSDQGITDAG